MGHPGELEVGSEVGGYRVGDRIGEGGMGAVYLAEELATGRSVAIKVLRSGLADSEVLRFERESKYARALEHPNIISVRDVGEANGLPFLVMDYVRGSDLATRLEREGPVAPDVAVEILEQVGDALDAVHREGIYHRDVKPANILIADGDEGEPMRCFLTDFGLSKAPSRDSRALTLPGYFVGTSDYVAPEQLLADSFDHRVDVYSLGCVLYHSLTGRPPFERPTAERTLLAHVSDAPPTVTALRPDLPATIDGVVARALAKVPDERFASCAELAAAARAALPAGEGPPPRAAHPEREPVPLRLGVVAGSAQGTEIRVDEELLIGRETEGVGALGGDQAVSRRHARLWRSGDGFLLEDLDSANGTILNGDLISDPQPLGVGDRIEVGGSTLVVLDPAAPSANRPAEGSPEAGT